MMTSFRRAGLLMLAATPAVFAADLAHSLALIYSEGEANLPYRLFLPEGWEEAKKPLPLVLFLHGKGESGDDNTIQVQQYVDGLLAETKSGPHAAFLLAPQAPVGDVSTQFVMTDLSLGTVAEQPPFSETMRLTLAVLAEVRAAYPVDPRRIYVTGLSMGAYGALDAVFREPQTFAAAVPLSGGGALDMVPTLAASKTAFWFFHGAQDTVVPVQGSASLVASLEAAGKMVRYTELPMEGHRIWEQIYSGVTEPRLYDWLFSRRLPLSETAVKEEVERLLLGMTLAEKLGQMMMVQEGRITLQQIRDMAVGAILVQPSRTSRPGIDTAAEWADFYDEKVQASLQSRLGIPLLVGVDAVHGHALAIGATVFPHNVGLAAARNARLMRRMGAAVADEMRATGCNWMLGPATSVVRDIRWGRTYEGWGEHPSLQAGMLKPFVEGVQREGYRPVLATAKHFLGDGGPKWGTGRSNRIDQGDVQLDEVRLRELHLPPYQEAIQAGVASIMVSYGKWNGLELHHHHYLLSTLLKGELGFDGFVVSDANGFYESGQIFQERLLSAALAGIDLFMLTSDQWVEFLPGMTAHVEAGNLPLSRVDDAVRRILRSKLRHGVFDGALADRHLTEQGALGHPEHRAVARQLVAQSAVLLENKNGLLPLDPTGLKVGLAGPFAIDVGPLCGGWTVEWGGLVTPASSVIGGTTIREAVEAVVLPAGGEVTYDPVGTSLTDRDVVIYVSGEKPYAEWFGDNPSPQFPVTDRNRIADLRAAGVTVVVVVVGARPLWNEYHFRTYDAVVMAWLPGTEAAGLADVIFGAVPFKGRLPHTWPVNGNNLPLNHDEPIAGVLYPMGYGLSTLGEPHSPVARLPQAYRNAPYEAKLKLEGVAEAISWQVSAGTLPPGLTLEPDGVIVGTPTDARQYALSLAATGSEGVTWPVSLVLTVSARSSYEDWAASYHWPFSGAGERRVDADGDGAPNDWEWLMATHPLLSDPADLPRLTTRVSGSTTWLRFNFSSTIPTVGDLIGVEYSTDLEHWVLSTQRTEAAAPNRFYVEPVRWAGKPVYFRLKSLE